MKNGLFGPVWMRCEEHGSPYPRGSECPKCAANPIAVWRKAEERYHEAEEKMAESFTEWKELIEVGLFEDAKRSLIKMPMCSTKVLIFRSILVAEENYENR